MPVKLGTGFSDDYFIVGLDDDGKAGLALLPGQVVTVTSADPATVVVTPDATPRATVGAAGAPDGTASLASGKVAAAASPAQVGMAINVTASIKNADGSAVLDDTGAAVADQVDTVTIQPHLLKAIGELFGTATAISPAPPA